MLVIICADAWISNIISRCFGCLCHWHDGLISRWGPGVRISALDLGGSCQVAGRVEVVLALDS